jgi:aminopeptidase N
MANGDMVTFSYSSIINTQQYLLDKTYGRKLARLIYAEKYGHKGVAGFLNDLIEKSYNITIEATTEAEYEVLDNNFYYKRTEFGVNSVGTGTETRTTEYYF